MNKIGKLSQMLGIQLARLSESVTTAESLTGGGIAEAITRIRGSSAWFEAGFVTYSEHQKHEMVGVPYQTIEAHGVVSQEVAEAMVCGAQVRSEARFGVAVTGVAGPGGGTERDPVGTVWIAWIDQFRTPQVSAERFQFTGNRDQVREQTIEAALKGLLGICERLNTNYLFPMTTLLGNAQTKAVYDPALLAFEHKGVQIRNPYLSPDGTSLVDPVEAYGFEEAWTGSGCRALELLLPTGIKLTLTDDGGSEIVEPSEWHEALIGATDPEGESLAYCDLRHVPQGNG